MLRQFADLNQSDAYNTKFQADSANSMAESYKSNHTFLGPSSYQYFVFAVSFMEQKSKALQNVSFVSISATYDTNITYVNGVQNVAVKQIGDEVPLNSTALPVVSEFYDVWVKPGGDQIRLGKSGFSLHSDAELNYRYSARQMQTLVDTLVLPLKGVISSFGAYITQKFHREWIGTN